MNGRPILTDTLVERMLAQRAGGGAPGGLTQAIGAAVAVTPQVRRHWWTTGPFRRVQAPYLQPTWIVVLVGLLLAAAAAGALIAGTLLRQSDELSLVPPSTVTTPSAFGPITWRTLDAWETVDTITFAGTPSGLIAIDDTGLRWRASDGTWPVVPFDGASMFTPVFVVGDDLLIRDAEPFWLRRSGSTWVVGERIEIDADVDIDDVAAGPRGIVIVDGINLYHSTDGIHFARAGQPPDRADLSGLVADCHPLAGSLGPVWRTLGPVIATDDGFVVLSAAEPADPSSSTPCGPVLWFSADGSSWDLVSPVSPFGAQADMVELASTGGRHVAVGYGEATEGPRPLVAWVSDDGITWERLPALRPTTCPPPAPYCGYTLAGIVASEPGWVILSRDGVAWTSADGRTWQELIGWPAIEGGRNKQILALSPGSIFVAYHDTPNVIGTFAP